MGSARGGARGAARERAFDRWLAPFWAALGDKRRERWGPVDVRGLLGPGEPKSVEPLVARVAPDDYAQVHHFVCTSCWDPAPLERVLALKAQRLVGSPATVLIIDDTALLRQGKHSGGVAPVRRGRGQDDELPDARLAVARPRRGPGRRGAPALPAGRVDGRSRALPRRRRSRGRSSLPD